MKINPMQIINTIQDRLNKKYPDAKIRVFRDMRDEKGNTLRSLEIEHNLTNGSDKIYHFVNNIMLKGMPEITAELLKIVNPDNEIDDDGRPSWVFEINVFNENDKDNNDYMDRYFHHIDEDELD